ncbi:porin [Chitinimonas arctica]|uniref:Porin n=1 Tax=Chitinimonas arctica TaxID=2594795 RepID=A0A516SB05_9NEIS|nr:porin [Chitinimonas arctica]QDQ25325.1 porin [Chitinimonas arctica]
MRKSLLATLVMGAIAAPVFADGTVTLYGQVNVTGVFHSNGSHDRVGGVDQKVTQFKVDQGNTPSRIGFKGDEDLGNGLKAVWQIETRVNTDDAANSAFASREGWVGLQGGFGKISLGRGKTPYAQLADVFDGTVDGYNNLAIYTESADAEKFAGKPINNRFNNAVRYDSANMDGFSGHLMYGTDENKTAAGNAGNKWSLAGRYTAGPMFLGAAFNKEKNLAAVKGRDSTAFLLAGTYAIDAFKFGLGFQNTKLKASSAGSTFKRNSFVTNASYAMGDTTLKAGVILAQKLKMDGSSISDSSWTRYTIGAKHQLSKRTAVFGEFSGDQVKGKTLSADGINAVDAADPRGLSIGLMHSF